MLRKDEKHSKTAPVTDMYATAPIDVEWNETVRAEIGNNFQTIRFLIWSDFGGIPFVSKESKLNTIETVGESLIKNVPTIDRQMLLLSSCTQPDIFHRQFLAIQCQWYSVTYVV